MPGRYFYILRSETSHPKIKIKLASRVIIYQECATIPFTSSSKSSDSTLSLPLHKAGLIFRVMTNPECSCFGNGFILSSPAKHLTFLVPSWVTEMTIMTMTTMTSSSSLKMFTLVKTRVFDWWFFKSIQRTFFLFSFFDFFPFKNPPFSS